MTEVDNTKQLNIFSTIRTTLRLNETIAKNFSKNKILQFEPEDKALDAPSFPYIVVKIPDTESEKIVVNNAIVRKDFTITILLRVQHDQRDKYRTFAEAILSVLEANDDVFDPLGYRDLLIDLIDTDENQVISQKNIVEGTFELTFQGGVNR